MLGNVEEWTQSYFGSGAAPLEPVDPIGAVTPFRDDPRVVRGGHYLSSNLRAGARNSRTPDAFSESTGFCLVRTAP